MEYELINQQGDFTVKRCDGSVCARGHVIRGMVYLTSSCEPAPGLAQLHELLGLVEKPRVQPVPRAQRVKS